MEHLSGSEFLQSHVNRFMTAVDRVIEIPVPSDSPLKQCSTDAKDVALDLLTALRDPQQRKEAKVLRIGCELTVADAAKH